MKHVVLTGGTGFIGSWFIEELLRNNVNVTALVVDGDENLKREVREAIRVVAYKPEEIQKAFSDIPDKCDVFYHIGWGGVSPEQKNNLRLQLGNIATSAQAVTFAHSIHCRRFVGIGTVAEYVHAENGINETKPPSPADIYGAAKVSAHYLCGAVAKQCGMDFNWVIVPSTFGERRLDNNIVTYTIRTLLDGQEPTYTPLEQLWDFLYIADVVYGLYLIGEQGIPGKMYGIGSGVYRPLAEYITIIRDIIDPSLTLGIGKRPYPEGKLYSSCVDASELRKDTGFTPRFRFEDGVKRTVEYFRSLRG